MYQYFHGKHVLQKYHAASIGDCAGLCLRGISSTGSCSNGSCSNGSYRYSNYYTGSRRCVLLMSTKYIPVPILRHHGLQQPSLIAYSYSCSSHVTVHQRFFVPMGIMSYTYNWTKATSIRISQRKERRNLSKDTVGLGITVTRTKGSDSGYCYGCGADLVKAGAAGETKTVPKKKGYWADQKDSLKKAKIKNWALCPRCKQLKKLEENDGSINADMSKLLGPDHSMTEVFRSEVGMIRKKEKAVVVMCIDAINVSGTLIRTIRNYVGGNPILLAITRCDLLPDYVYQDKTIEQLKDYYFRRCAEIQPAAVYLCSEDKGKMQEVGGIKELASDLWDHLNGRDPYVIGAANIGKSTLTDILIAGFINRGTRMGHFRDRLALKRVETLREARITKSALPGTTLQNIRVPCFVDHEHALWDTPGLLLDQSTAHFPIRDFRKIRAQRPKQIVPHIYAVPKKSFCLIVTEVDDEFPLLRIEIRLKKEDTATSSDGDDESPVHIVWNSTLELETDVMEIKDAHLAEQDRFKRCMLHVAPTPEEIAKESEERQQNVENQQEQSPRTEDERKRRKEEKRQAYLERVKVEKAELGVAEWNRREEERMRKFFDEQRSKVLAKLIEINQTVVDREIGMDIAIANFGWIGFACNRTAMIKVYAPNSGVHVVCSPTLALPSNVGYYRTPPVPEKEKKSEPPKKKVVGAEYDMDYFDKDEEMDEDDLDEYSDDSMDYGGGEEYQNYDDSIFFDADIDYDEINDQSNGNKYRRIYNPERYRTDVVDDTNDPWAPFSGKNVGWQFDADLRFSKSLNRIEGWVRNCLFVTLRIPFLCYTFTHTNTDTPFGFVRIQCIGTIMKKKEK